MIGRDIYRLQGVSHINEPEKALHNICAFGNLSLCNIYILLVRSNFGNLICIKYKPSVVIIGKILPI